MCFLGPLCRRSRRPGHPVPPRAGRRRLGGSDPSHGRLADQVGDRRHTRELRWAIPRLLLQRHSPMLPPCVATPRPCSGITSLLSRTSLSLPSRRLTLSPAPSTTITVSGGLRVQRRTATHRPPFWLRTCAVTIPIAELSWLLLTGALAVALFCRRSRYFLFQVRRAAAFPVQPPPTAPQAASSSRCRSRTRRRSSSSSPPSCTRGRTGTTPSSASRSTPSTASSARQRPRAPSASSASAPRRASRRSPCARRTSSAAARLTSRASSPT